MSFGKTPDLPPPPPPPTSSDPGVMDAKRRQAEAEARRRGRAATILSDQGGTMGEPTVSQPRAGATVLGG